MAKSSINFQKASGHSTEHNFRKDKPNYLLPKEFQKENEFWQHEKSEQEIFNDELSKAKRKGGRKPKLENSRWEAVLNLNANHGLEDVKKVSEHIEKEFNITCSAIVIHRDEGFVENDKPHYNYHAHINFVTYKDGKQNWRKEHIKPQMLSDLQTKVAELLKMERGEIGSKAVRFEHPQQKVLAQEKSRNIAIQKDLKSIIISQNSEAKKQLATQKNLKTEIANLRAELKEQGAVRADHARLEALYRELEEQIKNKELTIDELKNELEKYDDLYLQYKNIEEFTIKTQEKNKLLEEELSEAQKAMQKLKTENESLFKYASMARNERIEAQEAIKKLEVANQSLNSTNESLQADMSRLQESSNSEYKVESLKKQIEKLEKEIFIDKLLTVSSAQKSIENFKPSILGDISKLEIVEKKEEKNNRNNRNNFAPKF